jgi:hypothetical protein
MRTDLKTFVRMMAMSLVLVAAAAFVVQGDALAKGHSHGAEPCQTISDAQTHSHDGAAAHSHDQSAGEHSAHDNADSISHDHASSSAESCCGKFCSAVACVASPELASTKYVRQNTLGISSQVPQGIGPSGLKRPPRTIGMS